MDLGNGSGLTGNEGQERKGREVKPRIVPNIYTRHGATGAERQLPPNLCLCPPPKKKNRCIAKLCHGYEYVLHILRSTDQSYMTADQNPQSAHLCKPNALSYHVELLVCCFYCRKLGDNPGQVWSTNYTSITRTALHFNETSPVT